MGMCFVLVEMSVKLLLMWCVVIIWLFISMNVFVMLIVVLLCLLNDCVSSVIWLVWLRYCNWFCL